MEERLTYLTYQVDMFWGDSIRLMTRLHLSTETFTVVITLNRETARTWALNHGFVNNIQFPNWLESALETEMIRLRNSFTAHHDDINSLGRQWMEHIREEYRRYHFAYSTNSYLTIIHIASGCTPSFLDRLNNAYESGGYMVSHIPDMDTAAVLSFLEEVEQCSE